MTIRVRQCCAARLERLVRHGTQARTGSVIFGRESSTFFRAATLSAPSSSDDPDRPTLKNSSPPSPPLASSKPTLGDNTSQAKHRHLRPVSSPDEDDPDRPVLHRGKPTSAVRRERGFHCRAEAERKQNAAVTRSTLYRRRLLPTRQTSADRSRLSRYFRCRQLRDALLALPDDTSGEGRQGTTDAGAGDGGGPKLSSANTLCLLPRKRSAKAPAKAPAPPQNFVINDYDLRAFDLDFSNSPTFVLTAKAATPPLPSRPPAASSITL